MKTPEDYIEPLFPVGFPGIGWHQLSPEERLAFIDSVQMYSDHQNSELLEKIEQLKGEQTMLLETINGYLSK